MSNQKVVHIKHEPEKNSLSEAQKKCNKKIEVQKKILRKLADLKPKFQEHIQRITVFKWANLNTLLNPETFYSFDEAGYINYFAAKNHAL